MDARNTARIRSPASIGQNGIRGGARAMCESNGQIVDSKVLRRLTPPCCGLVANELRSQQRWRTLWIDLIFDVTPDLARSITED